MCLFITKDCVLKKAAMTIYFYKWNNNIEDYKNAYVSPIMGYNYGKGIIQPVIDLIPIPSNGNDLPATYFDSKYLNKVIPNWDKYRNDYQCVRYGYHGCLKSSVKKHLKRKDYIYKFIIPEGAKYCYNKKTGLIVASTCYYTGERIEL